MKSIKSLMFVCGLIVGFIQLKAIQQIDVINNTKSPIGVSFSLPEKTCATIQLKKIDTLQAAILSDSPEKIREAINAGANINQEISGKLPLLWAILLSRYNAIQALLQLGAKADEICTQQAIKMNDGKSFFLLVKQHGQVNVDVETIKSLVGSLCRTNTNIAFDLIKELANRGYNINELWEPAICLACFGASEGEDAVRFLLFRGANPNHIINNNINQRGTRTPLSEASGNYPSAPIVKILIDAGADINKKIRPHPRSQTSYTALSYTIERSVSQDPRRKEIIEILLEHGASL